VWDATLAVDQQRMLAIYISWFTHAPKGYFTTAMMHSSDSSEALLTSPVAFSENPSMPSTLVEQLGVKQGCRGSVSDSRPKQ
jgi:hypothetical protein